MLLTIGKGGCSYYESEIDRMGVEIRSAKSELQQTRILLDTCNERSIRDAKEREQYERSLSQPYRDAAEQAVMRAMKKYIEPKMDTIRNL